LDQGTHEGEKVQFNLRISERANQKLRADAERLGLGLGQYLEMLILDQGVTHVDYFAQQAAINSFIAAGLLINLTAQQGGPDRARQTRKAAEAAAAGLFGPTRNRPIDVGSAPPADDQRIAALFEAFGAR